MEREREKGKGRREEGIPPLLSRWTERERKKKGRRKGILNGEENEETEVG